MSPTFTICGRQIDVDNRDKIFFPSTEGASAVTKGDVVTYYRDIASLIVPNLRGRPITLERFPDGIEAGGFIQKSAQAYQPDWIPIVKLDKRDGEIEQPMCEDAAALVCFADQGTITFHSPLGRADLPDKPDQMIFDLDPPGDYHDSVRQLARALRDLLDALSLPAYVKSSGSRGFHVVVPMKRRQGFDDVREFAGEIAAELVRRYPESATIAQRKKQRRGRIFVDTLRNAYGQTAAAPYTLRALPDAPVACPLQWHELDERSVHPRRLTIHNLRRRLAQTDDPWRNMADDAVGLEEARDQLRSLSSADI